MNLFITTAFNRKYPRQVIIASGPTHTHISPPTVCNALLSIHPRKTAKSMVPGTPALAQQAVHWVIFAQRQKRRRAGNTDASNVAAAARALTNPTHYKQFPFPSPPIKSNIHSLGQNGAIQISIGLPRTGWHSAAYHIFVALSATQVASQKTA